MRSAIRHAVQDERLGMSSCLLCTDGWRGRRRHADSLAHPMTRARTSPLPSQESAQLQPPSGAPLGVDDGSGAMAHLGTLLAGLHCLPRDTKPSPGVLRSTSPHPIRVPSVCRAMTSPLRAGIPAFCCSELLTLSWCQMALEADDFISFKGARDLSAVPCRNQCASCLVGSQHGEHATAVLVIPHRAQRDLDSSPTPPTTLCPSLLAMSHV